MSKLKENLSLFLKFSVKLGDISNVIDVLESSFKDSLSAKLHDLHHLQECILKTRQQCIRHEFLENVKSRHKNFESWRALIRERKSAAIKRAWPDSVSHSDEYNASTLFIEDALSNIEAAEQGDLDDHEKEMALAYLQKDGGSLYSRSKIQEMAGCYPFESLRATADILFLRGSSDFVVAKQALVSFLPDEGWRHIIDDFSATFGVTKHSLLESFTFSFLDDEGVPALKEASQLLPKISSPTIYPKVAQMHDKLLDPFPWNSSTFLEMGRNCLRKKLNCGADNNDVELFTSFKKTSDKESLRDVEPVTSFKKTSSKERLRDVESIMSFKKTSSKENLPKQHVDESIYSGNVDMVSEVTIIYHYGGYFKFRPSKEYVSGHLMNTTMDIDFMSYFDMLDDLKKHFPTN
ncbi:hypothetical protein P3S67_010324 [Capsicum chacoense]